MRALLGLPVGRGACSSSCSRGDLLTVGSTVTMGGAAPGVLRRVLLRCVLGLFLRTRGFVGLVLVVTDIGCVCSPSVAASTPSEVGTAPPLMIVSIALFKSLMAIFLGLFLNVGRS